MSDGRSKLNDFSLLKSLVGGKSIKDKTDRLRKAHADLASKKNHGGSQADGVQRTNPSRNTNQGRRQYSEVAQTRQQCGNQIKTPFRMPQYGQKQQSEIVLDMTQVTQQEEIVVEVNIEKERLKEEQRLFKWLCQRFPKCFNPKDKRPLKIGISEDIEIIYTSEFYAPVDPYVLKNVIKRYVGDTRYQQSVLEHKQRFNLFGKPTEDFSDEHIAYAKQRLDEIAKKAYLRSQGIDIKTYYQQKREDEAKAKSDAENTKNEGVAVEKTNNEDDGTPSDTVTNNPSVVNASQDQK